jgi:hypothetical protein
MNKYDLIYSKLKANNFEGYQIKVKWKKLQSY